MTRRYPVHITLLAVTLLATSAGCQLIGPPDGDGITYTTDQHTYRLASRMDGGMLHVETNIIWSVENQSENTILLQGCKIPGLPVLQRLDGVQWTPVHGWENSEYLLKCLQTWPIEPGLSFEGVVSLDFKYDDAMMILPPTGKYRLVLDYFVPSKDTGSPATKAIAVSNTFELVIE